MHFLLRLALVVAVLFVSVPASAIPITYGFTSGEITVTARQSIDNQTVFTAILPMDANSFIVWDATGTPNIAGLGTMDDFLYSIVPNQGPISTLIPYGTHDLITINYGNILPGAGYGTNFSFPPTLISTGVTIDANYTATDSNLIEPQLGPVAADITGVGDMTSQVSFNGNQIQVDVSAVLLGTISGFPFGEFGNDLELKADIVFFGDANVAPAPEPSTGLLVALGLVGLATVRRMRA